MPQAVIPRLPQEESVCADGLQVRVAVHEAYIVTCHREPATEASSDGARAHDRYLHDLVLQPATEGLRICHRDPRHPGLMARTCSTHAFPCSSPITLRDMAAYSGSVQKLTALEADAFAAHIGAGTAHVLEAGERILGAVFVAPVMAKTFPPLLTWGLDCERGTVWYLRSLVIEPDEQGKGPPRRCEEAHRSPGARHTRARLLGRKREAARLLLTGPHFSYQVLGES
ncbi:MAG: hypothetical protein M3Q29_01835 [Chloroflexota bacterium]|nr:hypothetical protein [Chloroflexota bacterium]